MTDELENHTGAANYVGSPAYPAFAGVEHAPDPGDEVEKIAGAIRGRLNRIRTEIVAIGRGLHRAKFLLKRGQWMPWLSAEFGMSARTAENYMNVAERFGEKFESLSNLRLGTAYKLAARSTPDDVVEAVLARASSGEGLSDSDVAAMLPKTDRPLAAKASSPEMLSDHSSPSENLVERALSGQGDAPQVQQHFPRSAKDSDATAPSPPEPLSPTLPNENRQKFDYATLRAFEQLKNLRPERLRILCPALRVCDPASLATMLEVAMKEKTKKPTG